MSNLPLPVRCRTEQDYRQYVPVHVVWEITLACNLKCQHCGSRAGQARNDEVTTQECLEIVEQLAKLGTREITLIGGEAFLRPDWLEIVKAIRHHDIYCATQTGGLHFTQEKLDAAIAAGLQGIGVSIDGLPELHDRLRGVPGSHALAMDTLRRARAAGLNCSVNTQIGAETIPLLPQVMQEIIDAGAREWQIQLTVAMGNAVDNEQLLLQPYQLLELMPMLNQLFDEGHRQGLTMVIGNNIGYFGPYEYKLRNIAEVSHWTGCAAGQTTIALEADGTVKGCPSLPTVGYAGGNIRELSIAEIWNTRPEIHFGRLRSVDDLWGFCRTCYYADVCRGGCTWTSHSLLGKPGNNPYCHYRALELNKQGLRESIRKVEEAAQSSFAIGRFELIVESIPEPPANAIAHWQGMPQQPDVPLPLDSSDPALTENRHLEGRLPPKLERCKACNQFIVPHEEVCPACGTNVAEANAQYAEDKQRWEALMTKIQSIISR